MKYKRIWPWPERRSLQMGMCLALGMSVLTACGAGEARLADLTPEQIELKQKIDARRMNFQDIGAAFKAVGDELKAGRADSPTVQFSVDAVSRYAGQISGWFPEGSGPESGFKTDALPAIWEKPDEFAAVLAEFEKSVELFSQASQAGDAPGIQSNFQLVGSQCASCHEKFRKE